MSNLESKRESINADSTRNSQQESNEAPAGPSEKLSSDLTETSASGACGRNEPASRAQASQGHSQRVSVTPRDWSKLEALSEEFGLPYSKIYNMSFNALLEKLGRKEQR